MRGRAGMLESDVHAAFAGALDNGTVQIWEASGNFGRSAALEHVPVARAQQALFGTQTWRYAASSRHVIRAAQPAGREVTCLAFLADGVTLLSRCDDDTLKIWDIRLLKQAVHVWDLPICHSHTRMAVSPQQDLVLTGATTPTGVVHAQCAQGGMTVPGAACGRARVAVRTVHLAPCGMAAAQPSGLDQGRGKRRRLCPSARATLAVTPSHALASCVRLCGGQDMPACCVGSVAADGKTSTLVALSLKPPYTTTHQMAMERRVTALQWHPKLNQIFVGTGDRTAGSVHVLYDPRRSTRGALLCSARQPRQKNPIDFEPAPLIHTPGALPMYRDDSWRKRKRQPDSGQVRLLHTCATSLRPSPAVLARAGPCRLVCLRLCVRSALVPRAVSSGGRSGGGVHTQSGGGGAHRAVELLWLG